MGTRRARAGACSPRAEQRTAQTHCRDSSECQGHSTSRPAARGHVRGGAASLHARTMAPARTHPVPRSSYTYRGTNYRTYRIDVFPFPFVRTGVGAGRGTFFVSL
jgi:hypothetical protein